MLRGIVEQIRLCACIHNHLENLLLEYHWVFLNYYMQKWWESLEITSLKSLIIDGINIAYLKKTQRLHGPQEYFTHDCPKP